MSRPFLVLQHVAHEHPGLVVPVLQGAGCEVEVVRADLGAALPSAGSFAGLVVLGGPMGVYDTERFAWLAPERRLLADSVADGIPVLGICLGAQQLAAALGAEVTTGPAEEVGPGGVELTPEGRRDPVLGPEYGGLAATSVPCMHWHRDTFSLPEGAVHLAATRTFPHQAFRYGEVAYGLQFHVEVDRRLAALWEPLMPEGTPSFDERFLSELDAVGRRVLGRFAALAVGTAAAGGVR
jgi:GMP synthase-like glutamine amidotransferase